MIFNLTKPFLILLLASGCTAVFGQNNFGIDTSLVFNQRYTQCERKWVAFPKKGVKESYSYGIIYLDAQAGFTFDLRGTFKIDKEGHYIADTSFSDNTTMKVRLTRSTAHLALVPPARFAGLYITPQPGWLKNYYGYTDTLAHNLHWGITYNDVEQCDTALVYLNKVYAVQPHYKGLEYEMIFAYNTLGDFEGAIKTIEAALPADPMNVLYYRELGYAYLKQRNYDKAISTYKTGINLCFADNQRETKADMAINLAEVYKSSGSDDQYKYWGKLAKLWAKPETDLYNFIVNQGF